MSEPLRWPGGGEVQSPEEACAAALLAEARVPPAWSPSAKRDVLRRIRAELASPAPRMSRWWIPVTAVVALAVVTGLVVRHRSGAAERPADVTASSDADFAWAPEEGADRVLTLVIRSGTIDVHPLHPERTIAVHSPNLEARVEAQTFRVQVAAEVTTLSIGEGQAWVGKTVHLHRHETIRSDDPRLKHRPAPLPTFPAAALAAPNAPAAPTSAPCVPTGSVTDRRACYVSLASGSDLSAQNALFELGMLDQEERHAGPQALESFEAYETRFPDGPLASDASFAAFTELLAEHRSAEAEREGEHFLRRYPSDTRAAEVMTRMRALMP